MISVKCALEAIVFEQRRRDAALFACNGQISKALFALSDTNRNFYVFGAMGLSVSVAAGYAAISRRPTIVVEGDGNALMGLSSALLPEILDAKNFTHIVLDNMTYGTTGGQARPSANYDFLGHARSAGYAKPQFVESYVELFRALEGTRSGRDFILCRVSDESWDMSRPEHEPAYFTRRFVLGT